MVDKKRKKKNRKKKKKNQQQQQQQPPIDQQLQRQHEQAEGIDEGVWGTTRRIWRALKLNQKLRSCVWDATTLLGTHFMEQTLAQALQSPPAANNIDDISNNSKNNTNTRATLFWGLVRARLGVDQFNQIMAKADRRAAAGAAAAAARAAAKDAQRSKKRSMMNSSDNSSASTKRVRLQQEVADLSQRLQECLITT